MIYSKLSKKAYYKPKKPKRPPREKVGSQRPKNMWSEGALGGSFSPCFQGSNEVTDTPHHYGVHNIVM